jgi:antitoxin component YwqK of YwqJK toxin-antitoxin module
MYYKNGQLQSRGSYKNGKRDGLWEEFDVDGNLIYSEEY